MAGNDVASVAATCSTGSTSERFVDFDSLSAPGFKKNTVRYPGMQPRNVNISKFQKLWTGLHMFESYSRVLCASLALGPEVRFPGRFSVAGQAEIPDTPFTSLLL